jgi:hypothetical protein
MDDGGYYAFDDHGHASVSQRASRFPASSQFRQPRQTVPTHDQFRFTQHGYDDVEDHGDEGIEFDSFGMWTRPFATFKLSDPDGR